MQVARAFEEAAGAKVEDVSTAQKARAAGLNDYPGFDLLAVYPSGHRRAVEVKGRAQTGTWRCPTTNGLVPATFVVNTGFMSYSIAPRRTRD